MNFQRAEPCLTENTAALYDDFFMTTVEECTVNCAALQHC